MSHSHACFLSVESNFTESINLRLRVIGNESHEIIGRDNNTFYS